MYRGTYEEKCVVLRGYHLLSLRSLRRLGILEKVLFDQEVFGRGYRRLAKPI